MGATGAEAVTQLIAQNQLVLARLTEIEQSWRTYVAAGGSRIDGRDKEREAKFRKDEVEQRLLVSDTDKPFRRMFILVDSLRSELDSAREKRIEHESMMKVLKQKNTGLTGKLEAEQAELARIRKENDRLRTKNDQLQKTARARALTTDLNMVPASNLTYAAISAAKTTRPPIEAVAPPPSLTPATSVVVASSGTLTPVSLVRDRQTTLANATVRIPPGVGRIPPPTGPQHYAPPTQQSKSPAVPGAPAPARPAQIIANGIPAVVSGTPGSLSAAVPSPIPPGATAAPTQVATAAFVASPSGPPLTQPGLAAPPPQTQPPQFSQLQRTPQTVQTPYPATASLPSKAHPGAPPPPTTTQTQVAQQPPIPHADVLGTFRVPDPVQNPNEPFCAVRHAVEEDEFGAIAGRTAQ